MPISEDSAKSVLINYFPTLYRANAYGWEEYHRGIAVTGWLPAMTKRGRANVVHDLSVDFLIKEFDDDRNVRISEKSGLHLFVFNDMVALRLKKLDEEKKSSNIPTQQAFDYINQCELPTIPKALHLECGYILNSLETEIEGVFLTCPEGDRIAWFIELENPGIAHILRLSASTMPGQTGVFRFNDEEIKKSKEEEIGL